MLKGRGERSGPPLTGFVVASRLLSLRGEFFRCAGNFFRPGENFPELGGAAVSAGDVARPRRRLESVWPMPLDGLEPPGVPGTEPGHPQNVPPARGISGNFSPGCSGENSPEYHRFAGMSLKIGYKHSGIVLGVPPVEPGA